MIDYRSIGLYIINTCNRHCVFCFKRHGHPRPQAISLEDLELFCRWVVDNDVDTIKLAGGEPTTHPEFLACTEMISRLTCSRHIITNLMCEDRERVVAMAFMGVLANGNFLDSPDRDLFRRNVEILQGCGNKPALGLTIWSLDQNEEPLVECCRDLGIKMVRLDLSRASILNKNKHVTMDQLEPFKEKMLGLARRLVGMGVTIGFDCPLPVGMFTEQELQEIKPERIGWVDPTFNTCDHLYINPDLSISACPHQVITERRLDTFSDFIELQNEVGRLRTRKMMVQYNRGFGVDRCLCPAEWFLG